MKKLFIFLSIILLFIITSCSNASSAQQFVTEEDFTHKYKIVGTHGNIASYITINREGYTKTVYLKDGTKIDDDVEQLIGSYIYTTSEIEQIINDGWIRSK